jgi:hypothetical protein
MTSSSAAEGGPTGRLTRIGKGAERPFGTVVEHPARAATDIDAVATRKLRRDKMLSLSMDEINSLSLSLISQDMSRPPGVDRDNSSRSGISESQATPCLMPVNITARKYSLHQTR